MADLKYDCHPELKRVTNAVVEIVAEDPSLDPVQAQPLSSLGVEELKRVRSCVIGSSLKAREWITFLNEAINKIDRYFRPMFPRKRSRKELPAPLPNKQVRTSMMDMRAHVERRPNNMPRPSVMTDRERDVLRSGKAANQLKHKDRTLLVGSESWEKTKMTRRRSGMKPDVSVKTVANRMLDGDKDYKWGVHQRPNTESCSRPSEGHGFRSNVGNKNHVASPTKGKASRVPCSGSGAYAKSSPNVSCTSPTFDSWERTSNPNRVQITGSLNKCKRPFSTGSSSTPIAQWAKQKPPKHQCTKRTNLVPPVSNHNDLPNSEGSSIPKSVAKPDSTESNDQGFLRRSSNNSAFRQSRLKTEKISSSASFFERKESGVGDKCKNKTKTQRDVDEKIAPVCQKAGSLVLPLMKAKTIIKDESGDGVQRQGRSGKASTHLRLNAPPSGKLENPAMAKQMRSTRLGADKVASKTGRPPTKKTSLDQKPVTRTRCPMYSGLPDFPGDLDDDSEELLAAVNAAINSSDVACSGPFWKQVEPFFAFLTQDDLDFLKHLVREVEDVDATLISPSGSNRIGKVDLICSTLPANPSPIILSNQRSLANGCVNNESLKPSSNLNAKEDIERLGKFRCFDRRLPLSQRLLSALIVEEDSEETNRIFYDGPQDDCVHCTSEDPPCGNRTQIESETENAGKVELEIESELEMKNWKHHMLDYCNYNSGFANEHQNHMPEDICSDDFKQDIVVHSEILGFDAEFTGLDERHTHGGQKSQGELQSSCQKFGLISAIAPYDIQSQEMDLDRRILLELQSIGIFPESVPYLAQREDEEIKKDICKLKDELQQQVSKNKRRVHKLEKAVFKRQKVEEREREVLAMNKLVESAYNRHMGLQGTNASGCKGAANKVTKQATLGFVKRTLAKCRMFEETGKSCFSNAYLKEKMFSKSSKEMDKKLLGVAVKGDTANVLADNVHALSDIKTSANHTVPSEQAACIVAQHKQKMENGDRELCNTVQGTASYPEQTVLQDEVWSTRMKKRELLHEEVNGNGILRGAAGLGTTILGGAKRKRTVRDREGKVRTKEILTRSGSTRSGRLGVGNAKDERRNKLKPRQKINRLSAAENGLLGKPAEAQKPSSASNYCEKPGHKMAEVKDELPVPQNSIADDDGPHDNVPIDLSHLQLPNMEDFDMGGQGQDFFAWLNFEDDGLPDADGEYMGLEVPMDDLADLHMF